MTKAYGQNQVELPGLHVVGDLSAKQYHYVKFSADTANVILAVGATTDQVIGALQDAPSASGDAARVAAAGVVTLTAGTSTITRGATLSPDATGRAITGGAINGGRALEDVAAVGDLFKAMLGGL